MAGLVALWLACVPAWAAMHVVPSSHPPQLQAQEGLLLLAIDTSVPLTVARLVDEDGVTFELPAMDAGTRVVLLAARRGHYRWQQIETASTHLSLEGNQELGFRVEAGQLQYPGDLVLRPVREESGVILEATASLSNRSLAAIDWLQDHFPRVLAAHDFRYAGRYPDPFPAFYAGQHASVQASASARDLDAPPAPLQPVPVAMSRLLRAPAFDQAQLSPEGRTLALPVRDGHATWRIDIIDLPTRHRAAVAAGLDTPTQLMWAGPQRLVVATGAQPYRRDVRVLDLRRRAGRAVATSRQLAQAGEVLHARGDTLVFASVVEGAVQLHRIDLSRRDAGTVIDAGRGEWLVPEVGNALHWEVDGQGAPRLARVRRGDQEAWLLGGERIAPAGHPDGFREVLRLEQALDFEPVALAPNGRWLYALTDRDRTQRDAVVVDLQTGAVTETLFSRPGTDVGALLLDASREPVGVSYLEAGRRVSTFFGAQGARAGRRLARLFPGQGVTFASRSADARHWAVWVQQDDHPPRLRVVDLDSGRVTPIEGNTPWLDGLPLARTQLLRVPTADGLVLDAFLTLPGQAKTGPAPLVVMPHGGPIDIADTRQYDAKVQFLAALGYAVLRVNFRGSAGYGRAFREAGYGAHGGAIEDDVAAAIDRVTSDPTTAPRIDAGRMCLVGTSYGGYSGLMAAVRWPDRFRCVVSIGGVSDRLLAFTTSDSAGSPQGRAQMEHVIGDPHTQAARLRATSPLYRYRELRTPVMLAHGREDRRVDFEQARRLARMLALAGHRPVGLAFADEGHGLASPDNVDRLWNGVAGFLQRELGPVPSTTVATTVAAP